MQDVNPAIFALITQLAAASSHRNVMVVGDDDQAIFAFRGAGAANFHDFATEYPEAAVVPLSRSFRSYQSILDCARCLILNNDPTEDGKTVHGEDGLFPPRLERQVTGLSKLLTGVPEVRDPTLIIPSTHSGTAIDGSAPGAVLAAPMVQRVQHLQYDTSFHEMEGLVQQVKQIMDRHNRTVPNHVAVRLGGDQKLSSDAAVGSAVLPLPLQYSDIAVLVRNNWDVPKVTSDRHCACEIWGYDG